MARIKGKDLYLKNDDQIYFGNNKEAALWYDGGELRLDHTISGTEAVYDYHLITKGQVEDLVSPTSSGTLISAYYAEDEVTSSTTSTSWTEKITLSQSLEASDYLIFWYYEWQYSQKNKYFRCRVQIDDTTTISEQYESPANTSNWSPVSGTKRVSLAVGSHTIDIDYCSSKSGKTAYIRRVRIELWRVY